MNLVKWFEKGATEAEYIENMKQNKESLLHIKNQFQLHSADKAQSIQDKHLRAIILTEDWCGDAMVNLPVFMHIAREANIEARYLLRDENLELMDQYLTNGTARSIPIIILIDEYGNEYARWGPRAEKIQAIVNDRKQTLPPKDAPEFKEAFREYTENLASLYLSDDSLWTDIEDDMMRTFA
ncbi:MAG: thioredoxin family protein [Bacillus sp. (in: firmicutes)]